MNITQFTFFKPQNLLFRFHLSLSRLEKIGWKFTHIYYIESCVQGVVHFHSSVKFNFNLNWLGIINREIWIEYKSRPRVTSHIQTISWILNVSICSKCDSLGGSVICLEVEALSICYDKGSERKFLLFA